MLHNKIGARPYWFRSVPFHSVPGFIGTQYRVDLTPGGRKFIQSVTMTTYTNTRVIIKGTDILPTLFGPCLSTQKKLWILLLLFLYTAKTRTMIVKNYCSGYRWGVGNYQSTESNTWWSSYSSMLLHSHEGQYSPKTNWLFVARENQRGDH